MAKNLEKYWNEGVSFDAYLNNIDNKILYPTDISYTQYYQLNKKRIERLLNTYKIDEKQKAVFQEKNFSGKILIISEGWCGDAAQILPIIYRFFIETNDIRIIYRDQYPKLMDMFLNNGARSIPVVIFLDKNNNELFHWGPRPSYGNILFQKFKENATHYSKEDFQKELQIAYNKDKGYKIVEEILSKL